MISKTARYFHMSGGFMGQLPCEEIAKKNITTASKKDQQLHKYAT